MIKNQQDLINEVESFKNILRKGATHFNKGEMNGFHNALVSSSRNFIKYCNSGNAELVLALEPLWYDMLVKKIENDTHVAKCFSKHTQHMWNYGKKISPAPVKIGDPKNICFVSKVSVLLGHTEVMLNVLRDWVIRYPNNNFYFIGLTPCHKELAERLIAIGVKIITPLDELGPEPSAIWLREACEKVNIGTAVWLSVPTWVAFIFGFGIAQKQVFWSLKFHAIHLGEDVIHIGMTKEKEGIVYIHDKPWKAFQPPLLLSNFPIDKYKRRDARGEHDHFFLFASLAREEKFNSQGFVNAVIEILRRCPLARYLFTGRTQSPLLCKALIENGLDNRGSFIGWVDTNFYSNIIDCFLETFPFGCGITGMQALANGTTLNSLWDTNTLPRYYFDNSAQASEFHSNWIINLSNQEYINSAVIQYQKWEAGEERKEISSTLLNSLESHKSKKLFELINED